MYGGRSHSNMQTVYCIAILFFYAKNKTHTTTKYQNLLHDQPQHKPDSEVYLEIEKYSENAKYPFRSFIRTYIEYFKS